jgi:hypothetical protein
MCAAGLYLMRAGRTRLTTADPDPTEQNSLASAAEPVPPGLSHPSRLAIGLCLLLLGYHVMAYALPAGWLSLRIPVDRLWILGVASGCLVTLSLATERAASR